MTEPINLTELRKSAAFYAARPHATQGRIATAEQVLALIDLAEAAHELADAYESIAVYPEGAVGFDTANEANERLRDALARFTTGTPWRLFDEYPLYWCPVCLRVHECVCAETSTRNCPVHAPR